MTDLIGFIGYGSMGKMLVKGVINSAKINQRDIIITRKNMNRLNEIKEEWPDINISSDVIDVVKHARYIFLCMKPSEFYDVLKEIKTVITPGKHIISITSALLLQDIESIVPCKITKILPTVISEVGEGITLVCHNSMVDKEDADKVENILKSFSNLKHIKEEYFGLVSQFTSSGPGFYAAILQEFVEAGRRYSDSISEVELTDIIAQTVYGTVKLMLENSMDFTDVINRVAVKGGITEDGVKVMKSGLPMVFDEMFAKTMEKRKLVDEKLHEQFMK